MLARFSRINCINAAVSLDNSFPSHSYNTFHFAQTLKIFKMMPALWHRSMHTGGNIVRRHIMAALVVNQPGCLAQIANLFSARGK